MGAQWSRRYALVLYSVCIRKALGGKVLGDASICFDRARRRSAGVAQAAAGTEILSPVSLEQRVQHQLLDPARARHRVVFPQPGLRGGLGFIWAAWCGSKASCIALPTCAFAQAKIQEGRWVDGCPRPKWSLVRLVPFCSDFGLLPLNLCARSISTSRSL
ncbi:unnamed protein product [Cladocopium goreaui]|uniref:Uncharacterized protein n=1 Tax=Cladocopium goreaui TaxID=2562237 RepID=A0A9P1GKY0_9DINO|nr:unnamed protein product [Cladocopium goreaui]